MNKTIVDIKEINKTNKDNKVSTKTQTTKTGLSLFDSLLNEAKGDNTNKDSDQKDSKSNKLDVLKENKKNNQDSTSKDSKKDSKQNIKQTNIKSKNINTVNTEKILQSKIKNNSTTSLFDNLVQESTDFQKSTKIISNKLESLTSSTKNINDTKINSNNKNNKDIKSSKEINKEKSNINIDSNTIKNKNSLFDTLTKEAIESNVNNKSITNKSITNKSITKNNKQDQDIKFNNTDVNLKNIDHNINNNDKIKNNKNKIDNEDKNKHNDKKDNKKIKEENTQETTNIVESNLNMTSYIKEDNTNKDKKQESKKDNKHGDKIQNSLNDRKSTLQANVFQSWEKTTTKIKEKISKENISQKDINQTNVKDEKNNITKIDKESVNINKNTENNTYQSSINKVKLDHILEDEPKQSLKDKIVDSKNITHTIQKESLISTEAKKIIYNSKNSIGIKQASEVLELNLKDISLQKAQPKTNSIDVLNISQKENNVMQKNSLDAALMNNTINKTINKIKLTQSKNIKDKKEDIVQNPIKDINKGLSTYSKLTNNFLNNTKVNIDENNISNLNINNIQDISYSSKSDIKLESLMQEQDTHEVDIQISVPTNIVNDIKNKIATSKIQASSMMSDVAKKMVENYRPPQTALRITLNPNDLGTIQIVIKKSSDATSSNLSINMNMNNNDTHELFSTHQNDLRMALSKNLLTDNFNLNFTNNISTLYAAQSNTNGFGNNSQQRNNQNKNQNNNKAKNSEEIKEIKEEKEEKTISQVYM